MSQRNTQVKAKKLFEEKSDSGVEVSYIKYSGKVINELNKWWVYLGKA